MNKRVFLLAMTLMVLVVTGCSTTGQRWHPALCALAGAAAGGAAGAIANDNTAGAMGAVGGIAGALVCATQDTDGDADGDGVKDSLDACPGTRRGAEVDRRGCEIEIDSDGDGVADGSDDCPNTPAGTRVDASGCAIRDSDGDGVADGSDDCPNTPAGARVDSRGCELDSDGDGVKDSSDRCPGTPAGTPVNNQGCELEETFTLVGVGFEFDSAQLTSAARAALDEDVRILLRHPDLVVEVAGHTDSKGSESYNQTLSEERANAVRSYLISRGADGSKITARGYGESQPTASNDTEAGRAENRRVELRQQ